MKKTRPSAYIAAGIGGAVLGVVFGVAYRLGAPVWAIVLAGLAITAVLVPTVLSKHGDDPDDVRTVTFTFRFVDLLAVVMILLAAVAVARIDIF